MEIAAAFTSFVAAKDMLVGAVKSRDSTLIQAATEEVLGRLIAVQNVCLELQKTQATAMNDARAAEGRIRELEQEISALKARVADRDRYVLAEPYPGTITYRLREASDLEEPIHHLCQGCMDNEGKKSVLQLDPSDYTVRFCPTCKAGYQFEKYAPRFY